MDNKTKLDDVAKLAGVSISTASLALSAHGRLSSETRERVLLAARQLEYKHRERHPPAPADACDIAVLFDIDPEWSKDLFLIRPIIQEFERTLAQAGFNTIIIPISRGETTQGIFQKIAASGAVGVATIHFASAELILLLESAGIPVVVVMNSIFQDRFYTVGVDDFQGAYEGASYLVKCGHLRLGYVDCVRDLPVLPVDRYVGFRKAVEEYHLEFDDSMRRHLPIGDDEKTFDAIESLVRDHPDITGIFALDDDVALRTVEMLGRMGIGVPDRISILAPGDMIDYSLCYMPQITTMRIDTTYMGRIAGQMMHNRIAHSPQELHVLKVKQQLVRRGSVKELRPCGGSAPVSRDGRPSDPPP
jgi:LacI family transcriptional regulator